MTGGIKRVIARNWGSGRIDSYFRESSVKYECKRKRPIRCENMVWGQMRSHDRALRIITEVTQIEHFLFKMSGTRLFQISDFFGFWIFALHLPSWTSHMQKFEI